MSAPRRGNLSNVLFQVLKFLLVTVAIYQIGLRQQLGLNLDKDFAVVNATPALTTENEQFTLSFYVLHFFKDYKEFELHAEAFSPIQGTKQLRVREDKTQELVDVPSLTFKHPPESSNDPHYFVQDFTLPEGPSSNWRISYYVTFDGRQDTKTDVNTFDVTRVPPSGIGELQVPTPLTVVQGQRVPMPDTLAGMALVPAVGNQARGQDLESRVTVLSEGPRVWIDTRGPAGLLASSIGSPVKFKTRAKVKSVNPATQEIKVAVDGRAEITLQMASIDIYHFVRLKTGRHSSPGQLAVPPAERISLSDLAAMRTPGIVFTQRPGDKKPLQEVRVGDPEDPRMRVTLTLVVEQNRPPEPVYRDPESDGYNVRVADFFGDPDRGLANRFLNLNKIIIDPDGQARSGSPDIKVTFAVTDDAGQDGRGRPFRVIRAWNGSGDFFLEAPDDMNRIMAGRAMGAPLLGVRVIAHDEMGGHTIPLQLWR